MVKYVMLTARKGLPFGGSITLCKGGDSMVTFADLFQFCLVILGVITLQKVSKR